MILGEPNGQSVTSDIGGRATLDDLFRRAMTRRPNAIALIDPPDRERFADGQARSLTYAQADRVISAIAGRLHRIGLQSDAIVALQLSNSVESVLTFLAVLRAGMIAMPLPLLWRRADIAAVLARSGATALIVSHRAGAHDQLDDVLQAAAETFHIRFVCSFGPSVPDGVIGLSDLFVAEAADPLPPTEERPHPPGPAAHLAVVTWDVDADGPIPVARNHAELATGGLAILLESRLRQDATILTTLMMSSFAGLAAALLPWLLIGGTLALHHPFDPATFLNQQQSLSPDAVVLPGPLVAQLAEAGALTGSVSSVLAVWRAPDRLVRAPAWRDSTTDMVDIQAFGEIGLIAARRRPGGRPGIVPFGPVAVPRSTKGGVIVGEVRATPNGTVAMRGPMVPRFPFPPGVERTALPQLKVAATGFVDTGFACWGDRNNAPLVVTAPPPGTVSVGGYRFLMRDLQDALAAVDGAAALAALPDGMAGHRLAGSAADPADIQQALASRGANPLLVNAFRPRRVSVTISDDTQAA
ncbi:MAG: AMP-binding protein [Rhizobiales bacterium]|nr:AMP-binding protein [Hyphomicrobiales bacterium]